MKWRKNRAFCAPAGLAHDAFLVTKGLRYKPDRLSCVLHSGSDGVANVTTDVAARCGDTRLRAA
jgi:hypothetical protein